VGRGRAGFENDGDVARIVLWSKGPTKEWKGSISSKVLQHMILGLTTSPSFLHPLPTTFFVNLYTTTDTIISIRSDRDGGVVSPAIPSRHHVNTPHR